MDDTYRIIGIVVATILIIFKAVIQYGEKAIEQLNEVTVRKNAEDGDERSKILVNIMDRPEHFVSTVEIAITVSGIAIGALVRSYAVILLAFISVLFGGLWPKKVAMKDPTQAAYKVSKCLQFFEVIFLPLSFVMNKIMNGIFFLFHIKPEDLEENVTEDEIISMVNEGQEKGVLASNEATMISNIIEFDEKEVKDIMTHRKNIVAIDCNQSIEKTLHFMLDKSYSRFPLYEEDIDNIIGILHVKDVTRCYMSPKFKNKSLKLIARKPYLIPDTQNINVLFNEMQRKKVHMAIAVDEYGQTAGLVAMEDILEEIVGNILDEYDVDEKLIMKQGKDQYMMKGLASLEEVEDVLGIEFEEQDFDTLNGLLTSLLNRIPNDGEHISVSYAGYQFEILDVKNKMIRVVRVTKEPEQMEENEERL